MNQNNIKLQEELDIEQCPHCGKSKPTLTIVSRFTTSGKIAQQERHWRTFILG